MISAFTQIKIVYINKTLTCRKMALKNFTEDENYKTVQELNCSAEFVRGIESELIFLSALNIFLSIAAFLGNTLILVSCSTQGNFTSSAVQTPVS